ncbi:hypothetical protein GCM10011613_24710 [Cellvibrio zantedeschiae]|uniref:Uncharacterized protein n=1 Tax=Cellvibrio zantedeschiae TaxID=1237077 RepID=A0ABQ3B8T4_9GAMM|nr:hypothetical protein [Cellvibrio zantedeschiae]GGY78990.1 hypothetical protein GCM10011613_24710 [Cellvibrio zantedeschiae]
MSSTKDTDYEHANDRGNGPKERMEGGDQTDDIDINDPETREKHLKGIKYQERKSQDKKGKL